MPEYKPCAEGVRAAELCVQGREAKAAGDKTALLAFSPWLYSWEAGSETVWSDTDLIGCLSLKGR